MKGTKDLHFFFEGGYQVQSGGGGLRVPVRHIRAGPTGWLAACPKWVI